MMYHVCQCMMCTHLDLSMYDVQNCAWTNCKIIFKNVRTVCCIAYANLKLYLVYQSTTVPDTTCSCSKVLYLWYTLL